jgi:hypothetical protein
MSYRLFCQNHPISFHLKGNVLPPPLLVISARLSPVTCSVDLTSAPPPAPLLLRRSRRPRRLIRRSLVTFVLADRRRRGDQGEMIPFSCKALDLAAAAAFSSLQSLARRSSPPLPGLFPVSYPPRARRRVKEGPTHLRRRGPQPDGPDAAPRAPARTLGRH